MTPEVDLRVPGLSRAGTEGAVAAPQEHPPHATFGCRRRVPGPCPAPASRPSPRRSVLGRGWGGTPASDAAPPRAWVSHTADFRAGPAPCSHPRPSDLSPVGGDHGVSARPGPGALGRQAGHGPGAAPMRVPGGGCAQQRRGHGVTGVQILRQGVWASLTGGWFFDPHRAPSPTASTSMSGSSTPPSLSCCTW